MADIVRIVRVTGRAEGLDDLTRALDRVKDAVAGVSQVTVGAERLDPLRSYTSIQGKLDPASRAIRQFARDVETVTRQMERTSGPSAFDQYGRDIDRLQQKLQALGTKWSSGEAIDPARLIGAQRSSGSARDSASAFQENWKQEADEVTASLRKQQTEYERLGRVRSELMQRADPLGSAQERHNIALREADDLRQRGLVTEQQLARIMEHEAAVMRGVERDFGQGKSGFRQNQRTNLGYQGYDIITGLASGQPLPLIAGQQLPLIAQILGDHKDGLRGGVSALAMDLAGLVTPARLAFVGIGALAIGAAYSVSRLSDSMKELRLITTSGRGLGSGLTAQDIDAMASGRGGLSRNAARADIGIYAATGRIDRSLNARLGDASRDYALTTGQDGTDAAKEFAEALAYPTKGLETLEKRLGPVNAGTAEFIRRQDAIGNRTAAASALFDAYNGRLARHSEHLSNLARGWETLSKWLSEGSDSLARGISLASKGSSVSYTDWMDPSRRPGIEAAQRAAGNKTAMDATIAAMNAKQKAEQDRIATAVADVRPLIGNLDPDIAKAKELADAYELLNTRLKDESVIAALEAAGISRSQYAEVVAKAKGANATFITSEQRAAEQHAVTLNSIKANTAAQEAAAAVEQKLLELKGQGVSASERATAARNIEIETLAKYAKAIEDSVRSSEYALKSAGKLAYPRALQELQNQLDERNRLNPENRAGNQRDFILRRQALDKDQIGGPQQQANLGLKEQIAALEVQKNSLYASADGAAYFATKQDLINQYLRAGITPGADLMKQIDDLAKGYGRAAGEADKFQRSAQNIVQGMDEIRSSSRGALTGFMSDLRQGKDPRQALMGAFNRQTDQALDRLISKPLTEFVIGQDGKAGGGMFGDMISKVFATNPMSTAAMTVTAGVVNIGGIGGIPGLAGADGTTGSIGAAASGTQAASINQGGIFGSLFGWLGLGGAAAGTAVATATSRAAMSGRTLVQDGAGRVLSFGQGGSGGLPITVRPSGVAPTPAEEVLSDQVLPYRTRPETPFLPFPLTGRGAPLLFDPRTSAVNQNMYLDRGPGGQDMVREMNALAEARRAQESLGSVSTAATEAASKVSDLGSSSATAASSLVDNLGKALGNTGGGGFNIGGIFGMGSAQAATPASVPAYAEGTDFHPGGLAMVGEKGPELLRLPRGSQVVPNRDLGSYATPVPLPPAAMMMPVAAPAGPTSYTNAPNVTVHVPPMAGGVTAEAVAAHVASEIARNNKYMDPRRR